MVHADFSQNGASCDECLELAKLHSTAVDFIKTGVPAVFPANLRLFKYPHFMENVNKDKYESNKVLGKIFDICEKKISDNSSHHQQLLLDEDLYTAGSELFLENASNLLREYNEELWQVMRHYGIDNEFEALSGFVLSFSRRASPKGSRGGDAQQRLNSAIHSIKTRFRLIYLREIQDSVESSISDLGDKSLIYSTRAQQIASSWYYCTYHQQCHDGLPPFVSFPWIAFETLCEIKRSSTAKSKK
jgi:RNA-dependent RNA polymerase